MNGMSRVPVLLALALAGSVMIQTSCKGEAMDDATLRNGLSAIGRTKLFFAHQSVGANILEGIDELARRLGTVTPPIREAGIGTNGDPEGKIRDFDRIMRAGMAAQTDIAFMKLCYADIDEGTDAAALFDAYRRTLRDLERDFPDVVFVHLTAPLTAFSFKDRIKTMLGRATDSREGNLRREAYNTLLREEFGAAGTLFDLALAEATSERGSVARREYRNKTFYLLRAEYTADGGHLNERGRSHAAAALVSFLAGIIGQ